MSFAGRGEPLDSQGVAEAASLLGVPASVLWAVVTVETAGCGFLPDRRPVVLFERHEFRRRTAGRFDASHPDISGPPGGYGAPGKHQHARLEAAVKQHRQAALESASWGLGQIMGYNAKLAGFADAEAMTRQFCRSENAQLIGMVRFIRSRGLDKPLKLGTWADFARGYNGPGYAKNSYDTKLAHHADRFASQPMPDLTVRSIQLLLAYEGFAPGAVDGYVGQQTRRAIAAFRAANRFGEGEGHDEALLAELLRRLPSGEAEKAETPTTPPAAVEGA